MKKIDLTYPVLGVVAVAVFLVLFSMNSPSANVTADINPGIDAQAQLDDQELIPRLLLQEAIAQQVTVTEEDVNSAIKLLILRSNMTEEDYYSFVLGTYPDIESFRAKINDNLRIIKLVNENVDISSINISDEDVDNFIDEKSEVMPIDQLESDPEFREKFYSLAKQQMFQNRQQQLMNSYVQEIMEKYSEK